MQVSGNGTYECFRWSVYCHLNIDRNRLDETISKNFEKRLNLKYQEKMIKIQNLDQPKVSNPSPDNRGLNKTARYELTIVVAVYNEDY